MTPPLSDADLAAPTTEAGKAMADFMHAYLNADGNSPGYEAVAAKVAAVEVEAVRTLTAERDAVREALRRYGTHGLVDDGSRLCPALIGASRYPCECGLSAALGGDA